MDAPFGSWGTRTFIAGLAADALTAIGLRSRIVADPSDLWALPALAIAAAVRGLVNGTSKGPSAMTAERTSNAPSWMT